MADPSDNALEPLAAVATFMSDARRSYQSGNRVAIYPGIVSKIITDYRQLSELRHSIAEINDPGFKVEIEEFFAIMADNEATSGEEADGVVDLIDRVPLAFGVAVLGIGIAALLATLKASAMVFPQIPAIAIGVGLSVITVSAIVRWSLKKSANRAKLRATKIRRLLGK